MPEEAFGNFEEIVEKDDLLDVNAILAGAPPTTTPEDKEDKKDPEKKDPEKKETEPILDVNKALEGVEDLIEDDKTDPEDDEDDKDDEDKNKGVKDTEDSTPDHKDTDDTPSSSDAPFAVIFARDLSGRGLLSEFDEDEFNSAIEEDGEAEALRQLIQKEVNSNVEAAKSDFDQGYQDYLELVGKGVPQEQADGLTVLKDFFDTVEEDVLEENVELRREVMTRHLRATTSLTDARIKKMIDRSVDLGEDVEESKEASKEMKSLISQEIDNAKQAAAAQVEAQQAEQARQLKMLKESVSAMQEVIPGQKINKQTKDKIYNDIVKPVIDKHGQETNALWAKRAEDPVFFDSRIAYLLETGFFEKGKSWDKVKRIKTTKESSELEEHLSKKRNTSSSTGVMPQREDLKNDQLQNIIDSTGSIL